MKKRSSKWKEVFSFTFRQAVKGKSYITTLISMAIVIFALFVGVHLIYGYVTEDEEDENTTQDAFVEELEIINHTDYAMDELEDAILEQYQLTVQVQNNSEADDMEEYVNAIPADSPKMVLVIEKEEEEQAFSFTVWMKPEGVLDNREAKNQMEDIADTAAETFRSVRYRHAGITEEMETYLAFDVYSSVEEVGEMGRSLAEILLGLFVPMIVCLVMYMLVLMNGQSIAKSIVEEKTSKLMEYMLTSTSGESILIGKILGMLSCAMLQIFVWIASGFAGYQAGYFIAGQVFAHYTSPLKVFVEIMSVANVSSAFSAPAVILGVIALLAGFFMYCNVAALSTSGVTKAEGLANGNGVFTLVTVAGFLAAYMGPLMGFPKIVMSIMRYFPVTSPFLVPSDVIIGNCSMMSALISIGIMVIITVILIKLTAKIYIKKLF